MNYRHQLSRETMEGWEAHGQSGWRPSIAYPFFVGLGLRKAKCGCGRKFKNKEEYEAHYLYYAIWKGESTVMPVVWRDVTKVVE